MTKHTIQVEKTVEEKEEVYTCNGCGLEADGEKETYVPKNADYNDDREIHLHDDCENDLLTSGEVDKSSIKSRIPDFRAGEYLSSYYQAVVTFFSFSLTASKWILLLAFLPLTFIKFEEDTDASMGMVWYIWFCCVIVTGIIASGTVL